MLKCRAEGCENEYNEDDVMDPVCSDRCLNKWLKVDDGFDRYCVKREDIEGVMCEDTTEAEALKCTQ